MIDIQPCDGLETAHPGRIAAGGVNPILPLSGRYSGSAFNKNIPSDIDFFRRLAKNLGAKYVVQERINPHDFLKTSYKATHGASSTNAYYIMLRSKGPKFLDNGREMILDNPSAKANRKDRHHIFPTALIRSKGIQSRWTNSIVNVCYLSANENQSISSKPPRQYLPIYKRKRHFGGVMRSCLVPYKASSPIWDGSVKQAFLGIVNLRGKLIVKEIEKLAGGVRIFETFDAIKRL